MEIETKEIIKLTTVELLAHLENRADRVAVRLDDIFSRDHGYRRRKSGYVGPRDVDWENFRQRINRLKRRGFIRKTVENKSHYLELTQTGQEYLKSKDLRSLKVERPGRWDKKWRIVMYDIPEDEREMRDAIRESLYELGFEQIQKSVFVYPFECTVEINVICQHYGERSCIKFLIAEIIEGEESIVEKFMDKKVLLLSDLA